MPNLIHITFSHLCRHKPHVWPIFLWSSFNSHWLQNMLFTFVPPSSIHITICRAFGMLLCSEIRYAGTGLPGVFVVSERLSGLGGMWFHMNTSERGEAKLLVRRTDVQVVFDLVVCFFCICVYQLSCYISLCYNCEAFWVQLVNCNLLTIWCGWILFIEVTTVLLWIQTGAVTSTFNLGWLRGNATS